MADRAIGDVVEVRTDSGWERATVDRIEVRTWESGTPRWLYVRLGRVMPYRLPSGRVVDTDLWTTPDRPEYVRTPASAVRLCHFFGEGRCWGEDDILAADDDENTQWWTCEGHRNCWDHEGNDRPILDVRRYDPTRFTPP